jgi:hypothetical protein
MRLTLKNHFELMTKDANTMGIICEKYAPFSQNSFIRADKELPKKLEEDRQSRTQATPVS